MASSNGAAAVAAGGKTALFAFGRYQPFTVGHRKLVEKMLEDAKDIPNSKVFLFISASCDEIPEPNLENGSRPAKRSRKVIKHLVEEYENPLTSDERKEFIDKIYQGIEEEKLEVIALKKVKGKCPVPADAVRTLKGEGYHNIRLYAGSDRVEGYKSYLGKLFPELEIIGIERKKNGNLRQSISGTITRRAAHNANYELFETAVKEEGNALTGEDVLNLYRKIRGKYHKNNGGRGGGAAAAGAESEGGRRRTRRNKKSRRHTRRR